MAAMETANLRHHHGPHQPHAPLPASPTLTNPDMILPDYDRSDSPDPDLNGSARDHSPLMMWKNAHVAATSAEMQHIFGVASSGVQKLDHPYGPTGPITPTTPIIYGNGTMLSDIGEVTEVESTPGKRSPARNRGIMRRVESPTRNSGSDAALRSSPTMGVNAMMKKKSAKNLNVQRERRSSLESNSTVTTQDQAGLFADFDDAVSVGDSVFQGDDEESMASSYVEGTPAPEPPRLGIPTGEPDRSSTYSTTSLSRRAEEILANAKKRLSTMEGNLTRARSSLYITPPSYGSDASTPSPPFQRASTAMHSRESSHSPLSGSPGHSRMTSDIAMRNGLPYRVSMPRSQSALGAAGGYRQPTTSKSADNIGGTPDTEPIRPGYKARDSLLQPLTEDENGQLDNLDGGIHDARADQFLSPTFGSFSDNGSSMKGLQRSASAAQMRDIKGIKDQMKDLKGKISSLREQARVDSLKRRSLQSLRTPSPFTHSQIDQWYAEPVSNRNSAISTSSQLPPRNPWNGEESSVDGEKQIPDINGQQDHYAEEEESIYSEVVNGTQLRPAGVRSPERMNVPLSATGVDGGDAEEDRDDSHVLVEDGDVPDGDVLEDGFHDAVDLGYESESGESLYHDTVQHQISHEDREDAFDYEHFFLHSAMGTMSQQRLRRGSTDSYTSEDSVETTRGPTTMPSNNEDVEEDVDEDGNDAYSPSKSVIRSRRNSTTSVSTVDTFATAEEQRSRKSTESRRDLDAVTEGVFGASTDSSPNSLRNRTDAAGLANRPPTTMNGHSSITSISNLNRDNSDGSIASIPEEGTDETQQYHQSNRRHSGFRRPISFSTNHLMHRPSVSSFDSTGTNRSFPLVNKPKQANSTGVLTPNSSPDQELKSISDALMNETVGACEKEQLENLGGTDGASDKRQQPQPMQALLREDKYLVERLVAGLGKCVLGLTENGRASMESRMYRRRIDAARRILEGLDGEVGDSF
ncbi:hypothetical protein QBC47DRAFT_134476 [Echria macrotheca]|uniref:Uncharacterized protein n=1 Tax=Echria macrotheca TaxID=438768 RepID=A0AAJ0FEJ5_9PEZI|nr:hypothetical protein QBC47DRAFT_134476 [Echria macrotheca]